MTSSTRRPVALPALVVPAACSAGTDPADPAAQSTASDAHRESLSEPLGEVEITSWSRGRYPDGTIRAFVVRESTGPDAGTLDATDDGLAVRLVVEAVIDPSTLQPDRVRAEQRLSPEGVVVARELISTEFDRENAEGCE